MVVKQKNLRVFHIKVESEKEFIEYFNKNSVILKEFFLLLEGDISKNIEVLLHDAQICYKDINNCSLRLGSVKKEVLPEEEKKENEDIKQETLFTQKEKEDKKAVAIFDRPIRSGEEISEDVPVVVFGRVNSGAKLFCTKNLSIYGEVDGLVQCDGEFIVIFGISNRGHVIFNGEIIDRDMIKSDVLQKIVIKNNKIIIKEVL